MKLYTIVFLFLLSIIFIVDYMQFKNKSNRTKIQKLLFYLPTIFYVFYFTAVKIVGPQLTDYRVNFYLMWINLSFFMVYIPRAVILLFEYLKTKAKAHSDALQRVRNLVLGAFVIVMLVSAFYTTRRLEVEKATIEFQHLPAGFESYKIVQLSDIHLGSRLYDKEFYANLVQLVNAQNADIIVFTGDMVNNFAEEMIGFDVVFKQLKAKDGKFAVLGNHDSGDYSEWKNKDDKAKNLQGIKDGLALFGFELLDNKHVIITKNGDRLALVGVGHFHKNKARDLADLARATAGLEADMFKILLSHNPDHWERGVEADSTIRLTLSGHTHAGQLGVDLFGKIYSPVGLIYNHYNGLYVRNNQQLYVSHGLGYIGLPIMLGVRPEINVITLKSSNL